MPCKIGAPIVCLDADNTLWDTDGVFAAAQLNLLANVAAVLGINVTEHDRLAYVRQIDQELASRHHLGLRYPPHLLIAALAYRLLGSEVNLAARKAWGIPAIPVLGHEAAMRIEQQYRADLHVTPHLLPGVRSGLERMRQAGTTLVLVTEGGRDRVKKLLQACKIDQYLDRIIDAPKRKELFLRLRRLFGADAQIYMIGDQVTRDIAPAAEAGLRTIHVQGKFRPAWEMSAMVQATYEANTFEEAANVVLSAT